MPIEIARVSTLVLAISYPHAFHGTIDVKDGKNPNGQTLIGKINGIATGSSIISNNQYDIIIEDYSGSGGVIKFYINNEKADESFNFISFEVTKSNLTFDTILEESSECGNNICNNGECSSCPVDCEFSECSGNGRCDTEIGETCASVPEDCGVCEYCGDGTCNNDETCTTCETDCGACSSSNSGSSGGGGGRGGGGYGCPEDKGARVGEVSHRKTAGKRRPAGGLGHGSVVRGQE